MEKDQVPNNMDDKKLSDKSSEALNSPEDAITKIIEALVDRTEDHENPISDHNIELCLKSVLSDPNFQDKLHKTIDHIAKSNDKEKLNHIIKILAKKSRNKLLKTIDKDELTPKKAEALISKLIYQILERYSKLPVVKTQTAETEKLLKKEAEKQRKKIREVIKKTVIRVMIYEAYKMINPKRLAGESRTVNFLQNIFVRGIEYATKRDKDLAQKMQNTTLVKKIELERNKEKVWTRSLI